MKNIYELNQNIYITSDEEIKEGDWFLEKAGRQYPIHWNDVDKLNRHCKKIILTTDPLLDGVQAIDDEFLEWFVKNPSREYVNFISYGNEKGTKDYELIIPKEVPNQTDEKGRPMTYWGGLAEPSQEILEETALKLYPDDWDDIERSVFIEGAKWMEQRRYSYDEVRRIAYNAYCFGQFEEPTEGKFNQWIAEFKK